MSRIKKILLAVLALIGLLTILIVVLIVGVVGKAREKVNAECSIENPTRCWVDANRAIKEGNKEKAIKNYKIGCKGKYRHSCSNLLAHLEKDGNIEEAFEFQKFYCGFDYEQCPLFLDFMHKYDLLNKFTLSNNEACLGGDTRACVLKARLLIRRLQTDRKLLAIREIDKSLETLRRQCDAGDYEICEELAEYESFHSGYFKARQIYKQICDSRGKRKDCRQVKRWDERIKKERKKIEPIKKWCLENKADDCLNLARVYKNLGNKSESRKFVKRACDLNKYACEEMARLLIAEGSMWKARNMLAKRCDSEATQREYYCTVYGDLEYDLNNLPEAKGAYRKMCYDLESVRARCCWKLSAIEEQEGNKVEAMNLRKRACEFAGSPGEKEKYCEQET